MADMFLWIGISIPLAVLLCVKLGHSKYETIGIVIGAIVIVSLIGIFYIIPNNNDNYDEKYNHDSKIRHIDENSIHNLGIGNKNVEVIKNEK